MTAYGQSGLVVLVGAGPGEAGLITAAGASWISRADVIVYDRLVNPELLRLAPSKTERIYAGKAPGEGGGTQQRINSLLIDRSRSGKLVVRLKGGDPLIFGRGGEEAEALAAAGCRFRIVPGVTAALAAAAYAGIPLTDRRVASTLALVTAHEDPTKDSSSIAWDALAKIETLVFYMGVENLPLVAERLIAAGRTGETPAAVIESVTTPHQRTIVATLATIAAEASAADVRPPALIVVGEAVRMRERIEWREKLPLSGQTVMVTRPLEQAAKLMGALVELGAAVIEAPTVEIHPPEDSAPLDAAIGRLGEFDWVVLTSPNAVAHLLERMHSLGLDARALGGVKIAAVGAGTAAALRERFLTPDLVPEQFTTEALGRALVAAPGVEGKRLLLPRADRASELLGEILREGGAIVEEVTAYRTVRPAALPDAAIDALHRREVDWITFTSASTVENFLSLVEGREIDLSAVKLAAIGPVTGDALRAARMTPTVVADPHTIDGLVEAIGAHEG